MGQMSQAPHLLPLPARSTTNNSGDSKPNNNDVQKFIHATAIEDEINKANLLTSATQQLINMQSSEAAQITLISDKFNSLLSQL